jgi:23S rRNA (uracil1939-C5)-methyltransferase
MRKRKKGRKDARYRFPDRTPPIHVVVDHIGARGDGVASAVIRSGHLDQRRPVFVPMALPGERVLAQPLFDIGEGVSCRLSEIVQASSERVEPACPHFGACGGCGLQHWAAGPYNDWKRERILTALKRAGVSAETVAPIVPASPGTRRRADFVMRRLSGATVLGFHERGGNRIIVIAECPILEPRLLMVARHLKAAAETLLNPGESARALINLLDSGPDLLLTLPGEPKLEALERLAEMAESADLCRLSTAIEGEPEPAVPVLERRPPAIRFAGVDVSPPPGAFLQATACGAEAIVKSVLQAVGSASRIVELHAGCGTLSLPLLRGADLHVVEADPAAVAALETAVRRSQPQHTFTAEIRDLMDNPLQPAELAAYDALVFDPPRAGARAQAECIARGGPDRVAAVSCNPATFARDARILTDAGYRLERVTPIDQFLWSPHVELVASFRRGAEP